MDNAARRTAAADTPMLAEVRQGLAREPKELSPKFFYDQRGSELFEQITELPEYYLTRAERELLEQYMPEWIGAMRPGALVELGAGSTAKARILLDAMHAARGDEIVYVPVDVSARFLNAAADELRADRPGLEVVPVVADITTEYALPRDLPRPTLFALIGSTIGNFGNDAAIRLLGSVRARLSGADRFLLGVDLRKDRATLEAAYNDARGVTAEFNLNMLRVLNRELGADFDPAAFRHHAFYNEEQRRIEMHLVSERAQTVHIPGMEPVRFREGESMRTEISCKHDQDSIAEMFGAAGMRVERWQPDAAGRFALVLGAPAA